MRDYFPDASFSVQGIDIFDKNDLGFASSLKRKGPGEPQVPSAAPLEFFLYTREDKYSGVSDANIERAKDIIRALGKAVAEEVAKFTPVADQTYPDSESQYGCKVAPQDPISETARQACIDKALAKVRIQYPEFPATTRDTYELVMDVLQAHAREDGSIELNSELKRDLRDAIPENTKSTSTILERIESRQPAARLWTR